MCILYIYIYIILYVVSSLISNNSTIFHAPQRVADLPFEVLKFLLMDAAVVELLKKLDRSHGPQGMFIPVGTGGLHMFIT